MTDYDAIVVGSGIGGLSAATRLGQKGLGVLLLEAGEDFGGYIRPIMYGEYAFDLGIHYLGKLGPGETFRELLDKLGLENFKFVELDPEGFDKYVFPDYEFNFCKGREQLKERLIHDFPTEEKGIQRFLDITSKIDQASEPNNLVKDNFLSRASYLFKNPIMIRYGLSSYQSVLDKITTNKRLQAVLSAPLFDIAVGPRQASAVGAFGIWAYFLNGAYYPRGGSQALRDAFVKGLLDKGVELVHSTPVTFLSKRNDKWIVRTDKGDEYTADVLISNADPKVTICYLLDQQLVPRNVFNKANRLRPSGSIISTFIGTDLDLPSMGIGTGNICQYSGWDLNPYYERWLGSSIPNIEKDFFLNSPSARDPEGGLAPKGHHTLQILSGGNLASFEKWVSLRPEQRGDEYDNLKKRIVDDMVKGAERYLPGLSEHITLAECVTPLDCIDRVRSVRGGIYGPEHSPSQMGWGRYPTLTCGIDGLFLAGAGTFGCGLLSCSASGYLAAEKAATYLKN